MPEIAPQRLRRPTLAVIGSLVGDAVFRQLQPWTDDLQRREVADCKHLVPLEQPHALYEVLRNFTPADVFASKHRRAPSRVRFTRGEGETA